MRTLKRKEKILIGLKEKVQRLVEWRMKNEE